ncbi:hypothetical protein LMG19083_04757 [Ralstonia psammae]|uniref:Uncharacterized protein n=1 Tax=Ralstonia psammae TaxID=3058598 RepID=A0ABM9JZT1_9RALS|nr:hypothetical protein [Ralstonia sp. LMG 19083]CAJ0808708.1 hypothetical protein LMG19083_04757 [Ralstonia sp. LMG 19083]
MGLQLFNFAYNTLLSKANNNAQGNSLFLPRALAGMTGAGDVPYLPLKASNWSANNMSGAQDISNDLATSWFGAYTGQLDMLSLEKPNPPTVTQQMIDDAKAALQAIHDGPYLNAVPYPNTGLNLTLQQIEIDGLANVRVSSTAPQVTINDAGYTAQIKLDFNAYPSTGESWNQQLALGGTQQGVDSNNSQSFAGLAFSLSQPLCFFARHGTTPAPIPPTLHLPESNGHPNGFDCSAGGVALLQVAKAELVASTTITVSPDGKTVQIGLEQLTLQGVGGTLPSFTLQNLQWTSMSPTLLSDFSLYYEIWNTTYKNLLGTPDAAKFLTTSINNALNSADNLATIEKLLNQQLANALDTIFGSKQVANSSVDTDTNAVDKYLFDRARAALNDPSSYVYVPALVLGSNSPVLEPYTATNLKIDGPYSTTFMGQTLSVTQIVLSNLAIHGLSNLVAPASGIVFGSNQQASASLSLGTLNPGPNLNVDGNSKTVPSPPASASTPFSLNIQVGSNKPIPFSGNMTVTLTNTSGTLGVDTTLAASGDTPDQLTLNYSAITLVAADADVNIAVQLDGDGNSFYDKFIDEIVNQGPVKDDLLAQLNAYIGSNLGQIDAAATQFARNALNKLGS